MLLWHFSYLAFFGLYGLLGFEGKSDLKFEPKVCFHTVFGLYYLISDESGTT